MRSAEYFKARCYLTNVVTVAHPYLFLISVEPSFKQWDFIIRFLYISSTKFSSADPLIYIAS